MSKKENSIKKDKRMTRNGKKLIFCILILAFPILQYAVMSLYVKFNSFIMAFQKYTPGADGLTVSFTFDNFAVAFETFANSGNMLKNSTLLLIFSTLGGLILSLIAAFYIYKKFLFNKAFMCILFLPSVVSGLVYCLLFKYMAEDVYRGVMSVFGVNVTEGLLTNKDTRLITLLVFNVWMGFPSHIMLFVGGMKGIDESLVEYSQIDGVNFWQEFWYLTIPMIFPTLTTFLIVGLSGFFVNQMSLYSFYGDTISYPDLTVFGYLIYRDSKKSDVFVPAGSAYLSYPELSALGLVCTAITLIVIFAVKKLLKKFGPSVD